MMIVFDDAPQIDLLSKGLGHVEGYEMVSMGFILPINIH